MSRWSRLSRVDFAAPELTVKGYDDGKRKDSDNMRSVFIFGRRHRWTVA